MAEQGGKRTFAVERFAKQLPLTDTLLGSGGVMRNWRLALIAAAITALAACDFLGPSAEVRYRITFEINTPHGVRSASGVWAFKLMPGTIDQAYTSRFRGEAIPVDLPNGRTVFALLDLRGIDNNPIRDVQGLLPEKALARRFYPEARYPAEVGTSRIEQIKFLDKHVRNKVRLDCRPNPYNSECPLLVAFLNPSDPRSAFAIDPDDMAATLGRGYSLRGLYLQITDDAPTHQLRRRLAWESAVARKHLGNSGASSRLTILSFKRWGR